jgi:hypothetical protein
MIYLKLFSKADHYFDYTNICFAMGERTFEIFFDNGIVSPRIKEFDLLKILPLEADYFVSKKSLFTMIYDPSQKYDLVKSIKLAKR